MIKNRAPLLTTLLITIVFGSLSYYWLTHKARAQRMTSKPVVPLVEVIQVKPIDLQTSIHAMGSVIASQSVNLTPRISGMVIKVSPHFIEGGLLNKGEVLVELDPTDYRLAIKLKESDLAKAQFNLKLEQGQQAIVKREFQLLGEDLNVQEQELVLRRPHLNAAKAALAAAEASLQQARLDLSRTKPVAPFNAIITSRNANVGAWMSAFSTGTPLAKLVGTDTFWINASVPVDKLTWIQIPGINNKQGSSAKIAYETGWGKGVYRLGTVKRLQAELEPEGRMAKLIIEIDDPLSQKPENKNKPPVMLGTFVHIEIEGKVLENVIGLPESMLHDGRQIWLLTDQQTLDIRTVNPVWNQQNTIYLSRDQLPDQANIITSDLAAPVPGMRLRKDNPSISGEQ